MVQYSTQVNVLHHCPPLLLCNKKKDALWRKQELIWHNCCLFHFHLFIPAPDLQRWQRSCLILSRGTSRTLGGDHTCWWRRRRPGKASIIALQTNTQGRSRLTQPALFVSVCGAGFHVQSMQRGGNYSWNVWHVQWSHVLGRDWDFRATEEFDFKNAICVFAWNFPAQCFKKRIWL